MQRPPRRLSRPFKDITGPFIGVSSKTALRGFWGPCKGDVECQKSILIMTKRKDDGIGGLLQIVKSSSLILKRQGSQRSRSRYNGRQKSVRSGLIDQHAINTVFFSPMEVARSLYILPITMLPGRIVRLIYFNATVVVQCLIEVVASSDILKGV